MKRREEEEESLFRTARGSSPTHPKIAVPHHVTLTAGFPLSRSANDYFPHLRDFGVRQCTRDVARHPTKTEKDERCCKVGVSLFTVIFHLVSF